MKQVLLWLALLLLAGCSSQQGISELGGSGGEASGLRGDQHDGEPVNRERMMRSMRHGAKWKGFNALQTSRVAWTSSDAHHSLVKMVRTGANAVALVPFVKMLKVDSPVVYQANNVTDRQLVAAIELAHELGMKVVLKPQILVSGSWAGAIEFHDEDQRLRWFQSYSEHIIKYAKLAESLHVEAFVMGTELYKMEASVPWGRLIQSLRQVYSGILTYAAHGVDGVKKFPYWERLDVVSLTYYPPLGDLGEYEEMQAHLEYAFYKLTQAVSGSHKPVWLLEVGMPSADGFSDAPWDWKTLNKRRPHVDLTVQAAAIALWLKVSRRQPYIDGIFIWNWFSDPDAGGENNIDYTVQNKPAEVVVRQYWSGNQ